MSISVTCRIGCKNTVYPEIRKALEENNLHKKFWGKEKKGVAVLFSVDDFSGSVQ